MAHKPKASPDVGNDQAWEILQQIAKWISHAEGKASLTLASAGVLGGALFSLASGRHLSLAAECAGGLTGVFTLACGLCAVIALRPQAGRPGDRADLLYFGSITRRYAEPEPYTEALKDLLRTPGSLTDEIAGQIWVNSRIAARKFYWADIGLGFLIMAMLMLGLTCALLLLL